MSDKKLSHSVMLVFIPIFIFFLLFFAVPSASESFFGVSIKNTKYIEHSNNSKKSNNTVVSPTKQEIKIKEIDEKNNFKNVSNETIGNFAKEKINEIITDNETIKKGQEFLNSLSEEI